MKNLRSILNRRFTILAFMMLIPILLVQYTQLNSTLEVHKKRAIDSTIILADYFEATILFESIKDFNVMANKLDFKNTYKGIVLRDKDGEVFASRGEPVDEFVGDNILLKNKTLLTKYEIKSNGKKIGTIYLSYYITQIEEEMFIGVVIILVTLVGLLLGFYFYVRQINQIITTPLNGLVQAIHDFEENEESNFKDVESEISEIHDLNEQFSDLILQVSFSKIKLENWNKNLEETVKVKTQELTDALIETKKYQTKIIAQEKLASLGGLSAGIAHEIKNPLNLIINSSQVVTMKVESIHEIANSTKDSKLISKEIDNEIESILDVCSIINSSGLRADRIIKGMLSQARSQSSIKEKHNLTELCKQGMNLAYHAMRAKPNSISVKIIESIEDDVFFDCHFEEIERAIINLVDNAFDAFREKRQVDPEFSPVLELSLKMKEKVVEIFVKDNGPGIPRLLLDKVKEPFFTTKPAGKGTGLGISMINDIVAAQGGEFTIDSKEGSYTIMTMVFPIEG